MFSQSEFKIAEVLPAIGGRLLYGNENTRFGNFCIDSRYVDRSSIFVPLMGQNRDGHQYVIDSIGKGAVAALVRSGHHQVHEILSWIKERSSRGHGSFDDACIIEVRHTLVSLQKLAEWYRSQFHTRVLGITGSVGKTGTKEMLIQLLSTRYSTVGTEKNFNNEIGVPLALSKINAQSDYAVVEMAMRARGEISLLSKISKPNLAVITNTSGSHVGRLGSFEEVYKAKCEIVEGMGPGGVVFLNRRDPNLQYVIEEIQRRSIDGGETDIRLFDASEAFKNTGIHPFTTPGVCDGDMESIPGPDVWIEDVDLLGLEGSRFKLCTKDGKADVELQILGRGSIENFTAAAAVAMSQGMGLDDVVQVAPDLLPAPQRLNLFKLRENIYLIDDCYNSSPASAQDSLELMLSIPDSYRKILILGDMLELGKYETLLHRHYAQTMLNLPFDTVFAVGPRMNAVNEIEASENIELYYIEGRSDLPAYGGSVQERRFGASFGSRASDRQVTSSVIFDDKAADKLSALLLNLINQENEPTVILVKGSRALHFERIVNDLLSGTNY